MTRPPISSVNAAYESPRSMIEISGFRRPSMRRNIWAMKVFPPPLDDMIRMLASLRLESKGENGISLRWRVSNRMPGECGVPRQGVSIGIKSAAFSVSISISLLFSSAMHGRVPTKNRFCASVSTMPRAPFMRVIVCRTR